MLIFLKRTIFQVYIVNFKIYLNNFIKRNTIYIYFFVLVEFCEKILYNKILENLIQAIKKTNLLSIYILLLENFFVSRKFFEVLKLK